MFSKGDRFDLLFDNGEMLSFSLTTKPSKQTGTYFPLTESDMQVLLNEKLVKVKLYSSSRSDLKIICDNAYYKENAELSRVLFKRYVLTYWNALLESGFQWENIVSSQDRKINSSDKSSDPCYVYLMVDTTNGYHKIGISSHPEYREHTLQSEKPTIELLAAKQFPTRTIASAIESALHAAFGEKRLRGEWFELSEKDVNDIRRTLE